MLAEGRDYLSNAWWLATVPGIAISLVVLGANLLGDGLRTCSIRDCGSDAARRTRDLLSLLRHGVPFAGLLGTPATGHDNCSAYGV